MWQLPSSSPAHARRSISAYTSASWLSPLQFVVLRLMSTARLDDSIVSAAKTLDLVFQVGDVTAPHKAMQCSTPEASLEHNPSVVKLMLHRPTNRLD